MTKPDSKLAALEALLFIHGEPVTYKKIASVLGVKEEEAESLAAELAKRLDDPDRGLEIVRDREKIQLATKPAWGAILERFVKEELTEDLSPASLETLAIVAYLGPITRARIEYLRGVNSSVILRSLTIRGLIERMTAPDRAAGFLYRLTFDAMKHLGLQRQEDLPDFSKFSEIEKVFETESRTPTSAETTGEGTSEAS